MKIVSSEVAYYQWERPIPITNGLHTYTHVSFGIVKLHTDAGVTGIGITAARTGERAFINSFAERVVGADPLWSEAIWSSLWSPKMSGRRGYETRALSAIDFAVWDIKAKVAALAEAHHVGVVPHNPLSPVSTAACLQIAASAPNFALQEYPADSWSSFVRRPPVGDLVDGAAQHDGHGFLALNGNSGIGVTLRDDAAEKWPYRPRPLRARLNSDGSVLDQ